MILFQKKKTANNIGWVLMTHEKVLKRHELIMIGDHDAPKTFFWTLCWWIDVLRVQSRRNYSDPEADLKPKI